MQEVAEYVREIVFIFNRGCAVRSNEVESPQGRLGQIWRLSLNHLDGHDAQTPDVDLPAVILTGDDLGCHPVWRSDHCITLIVRIINLRTEAKVGCNRLVVFIEKECDRIRTQLDVAFHGEQDVVRLNVSMDNTLGMKMLQAVQSLRNCQHNIHGETRSY